jgi:hypothetical protein
VTVVGTTLLDIQEHLEDLATADGGYYLRCGRTGDRPVPAAGLRFDDRAAARDAARATEQYRSTLRQYDPRLPYYDVVVCEETGPMISPREVCDCGDRTDPPGSGNVPEWTFTEPVLQGAQDDERSMERQDRSALIECCHQVAAAIFEGLSERGYDDVERAVMDAYFAHAETIERPDELCLCLLESMASELETQLDPGEQNGLFRAAAARLDPPTESERPTGVADPVETSFATLSERGLVGEYRCTPLSLDPETCSRTVQVECSTYALRERDGHLPVLPIVLDIFRQEPAWPPVSVDVHTAQSGWRMTLELSAESAPGSLATVPITPSG